MKFKVQKTSAVEFHRQIGIQRAVADDTNCAVELWRQSVIGGLILRGSLPMKTTPAQSTETIFHRQIDVQRQFADEKPSDVKSRNNHVHFTTRQISNII